MKKVGGNTTAEIQVRTTTTSKIGEDVETWETRYTLTGWLDLCGADKNNDQYAYIKNSTNVFICDYVKLEGVTPENSRLIHDGKVYNIAYIDNPMELGAGYQVEIYLTFLEWL